MSEATIDRGFKIGLMINDRLHSVEMEFDTGDIYVRDGKELAQTFDSKEEFGEFMKLICIAREEMEKE